MADILNTDSNMRMYDLILKKRNGENLSKEEIYFIVKEFTNGNIPDYQMSAFLMAVYFSGMASKEITDFTIAMTDSGEKIDLSTITGFKIDKHSTGGVGDKTTLVLAPLVAACGGKIAKMSGCCLGHTGGTIDKFESIPGFNTALTKEQFIENVNKIGIAIMRQTKQIVPADKLIYALRDVTATVDSIPLIAASIMSKKLASGSDGIILDVKTGNGAFMRKYEDAKKLAEVMVDIGGNAGRKTTAIITDMNQPLGYAVGNSIEVKEAIDTLNGTGPRDLMELCIELGGEMLLIFGLAKNNKEGKEKIINAIINGSGLKKFKELIKAQGGNPLVVENPSLLPQCKEKIEIKSEKSGYIKNINTCSIGIASQILGAGRKTRNDKIDLSVGIYLKKKISDKVIKGETIAVFHTDGNENKINEAKERFLNTYKINNKKINPPKLILAKVTKNKASNHI